MGDGTHVCQATGVLSRSAKCMLLLKLQHHVSSKSAVQDDWFMSVCVGNFKIRMAHNQEGVNTPENRLLKYEK